ncbi:MAG: hypothetical protein KME27_18565 [Lyngbya sp. HA4199-MV5]|jgi:hypothetical protein|nr:hypothetical protein [Lyngbya sp. HA4199-MV5]
MQRRFFPNQLPEYLEAELQLVDQLGVAPLQVGAIGFDAVVNQGTIKWAVVENGTLLIVPKYVDGQEIPHTALTRGEAVLAAGEAEIIGSNGEYIVLEINHYSGHYQPSLESLAIGNQTFRDNGISSLY